MFAFVFCVQACLFCACLWWVIKLQRAAAELCVRVPYPWYCICLFLWIFSDKVQNRISCAVVMLAVLHMKSLSDWWMMNVIQTFDIGSEVPLYSKTCWMQPSREENRRKYEAVNSQSPVQSSALLRRRDLPCKVRKSRWMHYKVIVVTDDPLCETLKQTDCSTSTATLHMEKITNLQYLVNNKCSNVSCKWWRNAQWASMGHR